MSLIVRQDQLYCLSEEDLKEICWRVGVVILTCLAFVPSVTCCTVTDKDASRLGACCAVLTRTAITRICWH